MIGDRIGYSAPCRHALVSRSPGLIPRPCSNTAQTHQRCVQRWASRPEELALGVIKDLYQSYVQGESISAWRPRVPCVLPSYRGHEVCVGVHPSLLYYFSINHMLMLFICLIIPGNALHRKVPVGLCSLLSIVSLATLTSHAVTAVSGTAATLSLNHSAPQWWQFATNAVLVGSWEQYFWVSLLACCTHNCCTIVAVHHGHM